MVPVREAAMAPATLSRSARARVEPTEEPALRDLEFVAFVSINKKITWESIIFNVS